MKCVNKKTIGMLCFGMLSCAIHQANADMVITLSEAGDGTTDVSITGNGLTTDSGSATFSASFSTPSEFLGLNDNSDHLATTVGTLSGLLDGNAVPFVNLRIVDGAGFDTFQMALGNPYDAGDAYSFSGSTNFPTLQFSEFVANGKFTSLSSDALEFETSLIVVPTPPAVAMFGLTGVAMMRRRRQV